MSTYTIDYYEVLGVSHNATKEEIKAAYRALVMKWHPDHHQGESQRDIEYAKKKFEQIHEAYESLMNDGPSFREEETADRGSASSSHTSSRSGESYSSYSSSSSYTGGYSGGRTAACSGIDFTPAFNVIVTILVILAILAAAIGVIVLIFNGIMWLLGVIWPFLLVGGVLALAWLFFFG